MRVNVYAEEMTERVEIIGKVIEGHTFTGLRLYLELPVSVPRDFKVDGSPYTDATEDPSIKRLAFSKDGQAVNLKGPFIHRPGDDDSAAITFWGKRDLRVVLRTMLAQLDEHYAQHPPETDG